MQARQYIYSYFAVPVIALTLCACGQTGSLYLPDRPREQVPSQSAPTEGDSDSTASQERKDRRGTQDAPASDTPTPVSPPDPDRPAAPQQPPDN
jgi:predicted small lipoprotein YifL